MGEQPRRVDSSLPGVDLVSFQRPFLQCAAKLPAGADVTEAEMNHAGLDDMPYSASDVYRLTDQFVFLESFCKSNFCQNKYSTWKYMVIFL